ncbi:MAG: cupredoxin domain-containing protein [Nitrososphaerota archaeon]|nr:cupredoxin domain-containing protein [Nitrososphaerota archaeon]
MIGYLVVIPNLAYSPSAPAGQPTSNPGAAKVSIAAGAGTDPSNKGFTPNSITVVIGVNNTVTWTNNDNSPHTVTADGGSFDSGNLAPGATFSFTFTTAGTYKYHCVYHPWMTATVVVRA